MRESRVVLLLGRLRSPLKEIWVNKIHILMLTTFLRFLGIMLMSPHSSTVQANYFGQLHAGHPIQCAGLHHGEEPPKACKSAHDDIYKWSAAKSFTSNLLFSAFLTPTLCRWSDYYGRKPFLVFGRLAHLPAELIMVAYLWFGFPLWWYYPGLMLSNAFSEGVLSYAYMSDLISPTHRTFVFGLSTLSFSLSAFLGPVPTMMGWLKSPLVAACIALILSVVALALLIFFVPESLTTQDKQAALRMREEYGSKLGRFRPAFKDFWMSLRILFRTSYFRKLTIVLVIAYMLFEEVMEVEHQYFQEVAGFGTQDLARLTTMLGALSIFIQSVLLWFLTSALQLSNKHIVVIGITMYAMKMAMLAFCKTKAMAFAAVACGSFVSVMFPAIASIKSAYVPREEQGAVQGALGSAQALSKGIGPFIFLLVFKMFRHKGIYFPGAPFLLCFFLMLVAWCVALTIELPPLYIDLHGREVDVEETYADNEHPLLPISQEVEKVEPVMLQK